MSFKNFSTSLKPANGNNPQAGKKTDDAPLADKVTGEPKQTPESAGPSTKP